MTSKKKQFRAIFLAALMVLSVFAGTVALSGSAAAVSGASVDTFSPTELDEDTTNTHNVNVSFSDYNNASTDDNITVSIPDLEGLSLSGENLRVENSSGGAITNSTTLVDTNDDGDNDALNVTVSPTGSEMPVTGAETIYLNGTFDVDTPSVNTNTDATVTFDIEDDSGTGDATASASQPVSITNADASATGAPSLVSATHYDTNADSGVQSTVVEVAFNEEMQNVDDMSLYVDDEAVDLGAGAFSQPSDGRVIIDTGSDLNTGDVTLNVPDSVTDTDDNSVRSNSLDDDNNVSVTVATVSIDSDTGMSNPVNTYQGENVAVLGSGLDTDVEVEGDDSNYAFSGSTGTNSQVFVFNTTNREIDQYNFSIGQASPNAAIDVRDLGFNMTIDDLNVTDEDSIEGEVTANAGNRPIELTLVDDDDDDVETIGATLDGQGEYDFEFDLEELDVDTGEYTIEARDNNSGVTDTSSTINVAEAGEGTANFESSIVTEARGDVVEMNITMENTDTATVTIGSDDVGFLADATVQDDDDDGVVTLQFNTWEAQDGADGDAFSVESDDDELESSNIEIGVNSLLDAGDYDLEVRSGTNADDDSQNVATLVLEERETRSLNTWTASQGADLGDKEEVYEAAQNGNLTVTQDIAFGDRVVQQVNASGLAGPLEAQDNDEVASQLFAADNINYTVEQTEAGTNRDPFALRLNDSNTDVIADAENDTYFVVYEPSDVQAYVDDNENGEFDDGEDIVTNRLDDEEALTGNFTVLEDDGNLADEDQTVESDYEFSTAEHDMDEPVEVAAAENQTIEGTTTVAPGTELQIRVRSDDGTSPSFLKTSTVYVTENRTYDAQFDFSEQNVNDSFTVTVSGGPSEADSLEADGSVVEGGENQTETGTAGTETETTVTETTTEGGETTTAATTEGGETTTAEAGTDGTGEETGTGTPGFGVVVALVALLAAALLAVRRD
ncbi:PGF-CTERM protein/surface glycoprotein [Halopelagius inordinatus]|uniref:PGF-CTERM protein/surface glycoprotein n=1 Tax=Halopelagius inordinatus TaxID=553467 RepID=A0A1I2S281_9EURY|nr:BGTF surface domain-containing protein [Halopelagius inordinatus]SFG44947.1 PGF-CTERM protein/surface glycoprotein [Halopelagius inordinatus]